MLSDSESLDNAVTDTFDIKADNEISHGFQKEILKEANCFF